MQKVIFLNGPSSTGKTSIATKIQEISPHNFMLIGIDTVISIMPDHLNDWTGGKVDKGFWWKTETDQHGNNCSHIMLGDFAKKVSGSLLSMTQALLNDGHNVIIDEVCLDQETAQNWQKTLCKFNVFYIVVTADIATLEQREQARGDRMIGSARAQAKLAHKAGLKYDLMIDTSNKPIDECARIIMDKY